MKPDEKRQWLVRELYGLGFTAKQVSKMIVGDLVEICSDISELGGEGAFPNRPSDRFEVYSAVIKCYAIRCVRTLTPEGRLHLEAELGKILSAWLGIDEILAFIQGALCMMNDLQKPVCQDKSVRYLWFVRDVLQISSYQYDPRGGAQAWLDRFFRSVRDGLVLPRSEKEVWDWVILRVREEYQLGIRPFWSPLVIEKIDEIIDKLGPVEVNIVRAYYGLGVKKLFDQELSDKYALSVKKIDGIRFQALSKLRHSESDMAQFMQPIGNVLHERLEQGH